MGTADRLCGGAQARVGTSAAGAVRPWHALTASLSVVVCCFVWLCIRQCHELIFKTRAEQPGARARAVAEIEQTHARLAAAAEARYAFLAPLDPMLGLATVLLVVRLDAQPRMPVAALAESGDNLPCLFNDALDFSRLETARLASDQSAFLPETAFAPESLVDHAVSVASVWTDQPTVGWWMGDLDGDGKAALWQNNIDDTLVDFRSDDRADIPWQEAGNLPAILLIDGLDVQSGDNVGFNPGPAWQGQGAGAFSGDGLAGIEWPDSDAAPAAWLSFDLVSDADIGFHPAADWTGISQSYDLL
jgi:hypothetical protein